MKWEEEDIIESLIDDYCKHQKNYEIYSQLDNEVDANWESAICDYIFTKLQAITDATPTELADRLQDRMDGVIEFDPECPPKIEVGSKWYTAQDILYCDKDDLYFDIEEDMHWLEVDSKGDVYIVKGTLMVYMGVMDDAGGWPCFMIHNEEMDFAGDPFKIKPAK